MVDTTRTNGRADGLVDALALCAWYRVHPLGPDKRPLTEHGFHDASSDPDRVRAWWQEYPDALIGVAVPDATVVVDLDTYKPEYRADHGLILPPTAMQETRRHGWQLFYRTDGRSARQTEGEAAPAVDTRVGGLGYVVAWQPEVLLANRPDQWAPAPDWVYERPARAKPGERPTMETRSALLSWLGTIARSVTVTEPEYLALLRQARSDGRIVARDPARPWTDADLEKLAAEAAAWEQVEEGELVDEPVAEVTDYERLPPPGLEPAPPRLLSPLVCNSRSMWFGAQDVGKSALLVAAIAALADGDAAFIPGSQVTEPIRVGILDWEDNRDEWAERLHRMAVPAESVPYRAPRGPLTARQVLADVRAWVDGEGVELIAVDSVIPAAGGADAMKPESPTAYYQALRKLERASLSLAHVPKDRAEARHPFGSTYWSAPQRLVWRIERLPDGGDRHLVKLVNTKHSRWIWSPDMFLELDWTSGPLRVRSGLNLTDDAAPLIDRIVLALTVAGPLVAEAIADAVKSDPRSVRRTINRYPGRVVDNGQRPALFGLAGGPQ